MAQIPTRIIVNPSFEYPSTSCSPASYSFIPHAGVKGWRTLDSVPAPMVGCGTAGSNAPYLIEIWTDGFLGSTAHSGSQLAEINASQATFLYQEICLMANETVPFSVWHLRRASSGTSEQMVAELKTSSNVNIATGSTHTASGTWTNYTGTLTNDSNAGIRRYGFRAISGGSLGNLIDDVSIALRPLVDIKSFTSSFMYESDSNSLEIYVNGTLLGPATVTLARSGTATYLSDYTIGEASRGTVSKNSNGDITLTLPAGDYNPNESTGSMAGLISIRFKVQDEQVTESGETIIYTITGSSNGGNGNSAFDLATGINGQSAACATTVGTSEFLILDVTALPAKLVNLAAARLAGFNEVKWQAYEEKNVLSYVVEYSFDGMIYTPIGEVSYDGSGSGTYSLVHRIPSAVQACYRLKMLGRDGHSTIMDITCLEKDIPTTFTVYPNPSNGIFTAGFFSPAERETTISVRDIYGKTVCHSSVHAVAGDNMVVVDAGENLQSGMYFVTYSYGNVSETIKVHILR